MGKNIQKLIDENKYYNVSGDSRKYSVTLLGFENGLATTKVVSKDCYTYYDEYLEYEQAKSYWYKNKEKIKHEIFEDVLQTSISFLDRPDNNGEFEYFIRNNFNEKKTYEVFRKYHMLGSYTYDEIIKNIALFWIAKNDLHTSSYHEAIRNNDCMFIYNSPNRNLYITINSDGKLEKINSKDLPEKFIPFYLATTKTERHELFDEFKNDLNKICCDVINNLDLPKDQKQHLSKSIIACNFITKYDNIDYIEAVNKYVEYLYERYVINIEQVKYVKSGNGYNAKVSNVNIIHKIENYGIDMYPKLRKYLFCPKYIHEKNSPYYQVVFSYSLDQDINELKKFINKNIKMIYEFSAQKIIQRDKQRNEFYFNINNIKPSLISIKKSTHELVVQFELKATDILYKISEPNK